VDVSVAPADPLRAQLEHFRAVVLGAQAPLVDAADAARTLAVALAARVSAQQGAAVQLPLPGDHAQVPGSGHRPE